MLRVTTMTKSFLPSVLVLVCLISVVRGGEPIDIGSRRELFVDDYLIDRLLGDARQVLERPEPKEVSLIADKPWEGNVSGYFTVFQDNDLYRMYYRGMHYDEVAKKITGHELTCYAESKDGIHWIKPELGLIDWKGSKKNNIILWENPASHNFTPFKDTNPNCKPDERYKGLGGDSKGLFIYKSPDGIHWSLMNDKPVITEGYFDSQNLAFWDPLRKKYLEFHRNSEHGVRDIQVSESDDFLTWTKPVYLNYGDAPAEDLYTNAIRVYERAPHLLIGFPTRFLPPKEQVEPVFMSSRDGRNFRRWPEAVIPRDAPQDRDGNRSNYMVNGLVRLPGNDRELAVYGTEAYYKGPAGRVRRFMYRIDGFVSIRAGEKSGELITRPLIFDGKNLTINYQVKPSGTLSVEIQNAAGNPLSGFELSACDVLRGDEINQRLVWKGNSDLRKLSGTPVRLRIVLRDAALYSLQFQP